MTCFGSCASWGAHASLHAADGLSLLLLPWQDVQEDQPQPPQNSPLPDGPVAATSAPQPVPAPGSQEKAVPNKSLLDWLRQQSDYTLDVPSFGTVRVAFSGTVCLCVCVCLPCVLPFVLGFLITWSVVFIGAAQGLMTCLRGEHCSPVQQQKALAAREVFSFSPRAQTCPDGDCQYPQGSLGMDLSGIL